MRILVEFDDPTPQQWSAVESAAWGSLPPGQIQALNVQGIQFTGYDHVTAQDLPGGACVVTAWKDSVPPAERVAVAWTVRPLAPDARLGNAWNTRSSQVIYAGADLLARIVALGPIENTELRPWTDFVEPPDQKPMAPYRSGSHEVQRELHGWREWTEGVPADMLDERGRVRSQRAIGRYLKPDGTRTFFLRGTDSATGIHVAQNAANEDVMSEGALGTPGTEGSGNFSGGESNTINVWTTQSSIPNVAAWPTGDYRCQIDVASAGAGMTYGFRAAGTFTGHLARVNTGLTSDLETKAQTQALFASNGIKLATTGSVSWTAGSASDRFEAHLVGVRTASGGSQTVVINLEDADSFADGPWPGVAQDVTGAHRASSLALNVASVAVGAVAVGTAFLASTVALFAATVSQAAAPQAVTGAHRASTLAVNAPTVATGAVAVTAAHRASTAALSLPTVAPGAVTLGGAHLGATLVVFPPGVSQGGSPQAVTGANKASGLVLSSPTVAPGAVGVGGAHRASSLSLFAPGVLGEGGVLTAHRGSTLILLPPSIAVGPVSIDGAHRGSTLALSAPTVAAGEPAPDVPVLDPATNPCYVLTHGVTPPRGRRP